MRLQCYFTRTLPVLLFISINGQLKNLMAVMLGILYDVKQRHFTWRLRPAVHDRVPATEHFIGLSI